MNIVNNSHIIFTNNLFLKRLVAKAKNNDNIIDENEEKKWLDFNEAGAEDEDIGSAEGGEDEGGESLEDGAFDEET